jgi:anti-sigma factor RsiW
MPAVDELEDDMTKLGEDMDDDAASGDCPDFELLSRFADSEVADTGDLEKHLAGCARCASLAARLQDGLGFDDSARSGGIGGSGCANEESLILYLMEDLPALERSAVDGHLRACDACVSSLTLVRRRITLDDSVAVAVPRELRERAWRGIESALGAEPVARRPVPGDSESWRSGLGRRVADFFRLPVLVPVGVAVGAIIMVGIQESGFLTPPATELSRSVAREQQLRVSAPSAVVRSSPDASAEVLATVERGTALRVVDAEHRDWYRVLLPGDKEGWVEGSAFK